MYEFDLILLLLQQMCVYLVIAWALSKTPLVIPLLKVTIRLPHKVMCYLISRFSASWEPILGYTLTTQ